MLHVGHATPLSSPRRGFSRDAQGFRVGTGPLEVRIAENGEIRFGPQAASAGPAFRTLSVGRSGAVTSRSSGVSGDSKLLRASFGEAEERIELADEGLSQRWQFESRPAGRGALVVRVAFSGLEHLHASESGLHFADPQTGERFLYGRATWVDAAGARVPLRSEVHEGLLEIRVPAAIVEGAVYPAVLDPIIGPERTVDLPVPTSDAYGQGAFHVASGGGIHMVAWRQVEEGDAESYVTRVAADGTILDPGGLPVAAGAEHQWIMDLVWDGTNFIAVWVDERAVPNQIWGARIATDGTILDPGGVALSSGSGRATSASLAYADGNYLLVWTQTSPPSSRVDLYTSPMTSDLVLAAPDGNLLNGEPSHSSSPAVGWDGSAFLVAWVTRISTTFELRAAHVTAAGATGMAGVVTVAGDPWDFQSPCIGSDGTNAMLAWSAFSASLGRTELKAVRVSPTTSILDGTPISFPVSTRPQAYCDIVHTGSEYAVFWSEATSGAPDDILAIRVGSDGALLDGTPSTIVSLDGLTGVFDTAFDGSDHVIAWGENVSISADGRVDVVSSALESVDPEASLLVKGDNTQTDARVATDGDEYFVVWADEREHDTYRVIYGARLDADGNMLDPSAIRLSESGRRVNAPTIAWGGNSYFVVWFDVTGDAVYGRRIAVDGTLLDPLGSEIHISPQYEGEWPQIVGRPDGGWLVAYRDALGRSLVATLVDEDGTVLSPSGTVIFDGGGSYVTLYGAATNGVDYLLTFHHSASNSLLYSRVSAGGLPLAPGAVTFRTSNGVSHTYATPTASWNGTHYVIAWADDTGPGQVRGARVASDGTLLDPLGGYVIISDARFIGRPRIASDGNSFLVAWEADQDVEAIILAPDGTPDLASEVVSAMPGADGRPDVVSPGSSRFAVVYQRFVDGGATRVFARLVSVGGCLSDADCPGAYCVDAVCCDTPCGGGVNDCQACSRLHGAAGDGVCSPLVEDRAWRVECRPSGGVCDPPEACSPFEPSCPADVHVADGASCDDGVACNGVEQCAAGACLSLGVSLNCDDGDACTADACAEPGGCESVAVAGCCNDDSVCIDGDACTLDRCSGPGGSCVHDPISSCCESDADCADANACTTNVCNAATQRCVAEGVVGCCTSDGDCADADSCTSDTCDLATGTCQIFLRADCCRSAADCDDGNACTADACPVPGLACVHTPLADCCLEDRDCSDGDACTVDACPAPGSSCSNAPIVDCCHSPADCDDGDVCTAELCPFDGAQCTIQPLNDCCAVDGDCDDGDACTADACPLPGGSCSFTVSVDCCDGDSSCDDDNLCTRDSCPLVGGDCAFDPIPGCCNLDADCDDGDVCTLDACTVAGGFCINTEVDGCCEVDVDCDDGDACTVDTCDSTANECTRETALECMDAGMMPTSPGGGGCGCSAPGGAPRSPMSAFLVLGLGLLVYARRRRRSV